MFDIRVVAAVVACSVAASAVSSPKLHLVGLRGGAMVAFPLACSGVKFITDISRKSWEFALAAMLSSITPAFVAGCESETLIPRPSKLRTVLRLDISVAETMEMGYADVTEMVST
jgi:hypothetical protein